jgi:hypothetical protein
MGRADSAAVYCSLVLRQYGDDYLAARTIARPFALRRLVMLEARLGRLDEARKHLDALAAMVTRPDAEFRPLLAQAGQALATAEATARRVQR